MKYNLRRQKSFPNYNIKETHLIKNIKFPTLSNFQDFSPKINNNQLNKE